MSDSNSVTLISLLPKAQSTDRKAPELPLTMTLFFGASHSPAKLPSLPASHTEATSSG